MSQVSMQSRPASASHQHSWGQLPNGRNDSSQTQTLGGLNPSSPWQQTPTAQWDLQSSQPGLPGMDLRAIMQEEQQAAAQGQARVTHHAGSNSRHDSANSFLTSTDAAMHYPGLGQQAQPQLSQQQMLQQQQRSGGFYMRNKRDESVPVKQNWAQVLNRPSQQEAPHPLSGMGGMENGLVDLQMATEAFRDAFSATAPSLEGPVDSEQDYLLVEAYKSPANPITGNVHCLGCGKAFKEYITLAQHLKDKHQGRNADTMSTRPGLTLGDIMAQAHAKQAAGPAKQAVAPAKTFAAERHQKQYSAFTPGDSRGMREYLKRFPNKASLAMAVHKELGGGSHSKKKMSRLKRIILRERADKAATQAGIASEQATEGLAKSKTALVSLQKQLKEAEAQLDEGKVGFVEASALTHKQVLEMAVAEASRRVHEATKQVTDAEAEVTKKAEERAKIWKTKAGSNTTSSNTTPNTSVEIIPKSASATSSKAEPNSLSPPADPAEETAAAEPETQPSADDQYVAEQLKLMAESFEQDADRDQHEDSGSDTSSSDGEDGEGRGLEAFEDVLSSWLTAAHSKTSQPFVKAQASLPLKSRGGGGGSAGGGQSTLARIQEQQQQLMKDEEKAGGSGLAASDAQQAVARQKNKQPVELAPVAAVGGDSVSAAKEEEEEPESPTGIEGWKDVLSNWMTTAGVTAPAQHAQQADTQASTTSAGKAAHEQIASKADSKAAKVAEAPAWLADVSSDEEEEGAGTEVTPPRTSSITEQQLKAAVSRELSSEADKQSTASFNSAQQPQHAQHAAISKAPAAALPPSSPLQGYSVPLQGFVGSSGVSSQDLRLDGDLLGRARSDPAALWNSSAPGFPPRSGQEPRLPHAVATSLPAPMYPADQGLPPQALQNWKEQFKGLYRSFGAEQPAQQFVTVPNPAFAPQRLEQPPGFTANSHEFECTVCSVTCCGIINFEQHCTSKKHLRKAAAVAHATVSNNSLFLPGNDATPTASQSSDAANGTTYVGIKAQCRTYCKQVISGDLNRVVVELLQQLLFWQERQKAQDPLKAAKKKRLVSGLREVAKAVKLRKAKTVVVAPNIEQIESEGGLDDLLGSILKQADELGLPVVFALSRKKMGQVFGCRKKMSAIAILDYGGANELFNQMSTLAQKGREDYQLYYEEAPNGNSDIDPLGLTHSDSDSSQEAFAQEAEPVLYRLRADGRKVPITDGHGMDLARRKGLIQEVEVSPKRGGRSATKSAFGDPHTSQPETVALHSIELPQVQLGDREIADSPPEKAGDAEAAGIGGKAAKPFNLHTNPSLLQHQQQQQQQQRQQSQTDKLMTQCGLKPQDDSSHSLRSSQMLSASKPFGTMPDSSGHSMGRINSMSNFPPHSPQVPDMAGNSSVSMAPSSSASSLPPGYMPWWGMTNSSAPLPNQATVQAQASRSLPVGHNPAMSPYLSGAPMPAGPPRAQPEGYGQTSAPHPGMPLGARSSALGPFASSPRAPSMGHFGRNRASERSVAAGQGFNAVPGPAPRLLGQGFSPLGPTPDVALGPDDFTHANGLYGNSYGVGQQPAALPPTPTGYRAAYSPSDQYAGYPGYSGSHLLAAPQANQPWQHLQQQQQQQQSDWAQQAQQAQQQAQQAQHMNPYQQSQGVTARSSRDHCQQQQQQSDWAQQAQQQQQQQQQQMMHNMPQHQLNAHAQEWKPRWA